MVVATVLYYDVLYVGNVLAMGAGFVQHDHCWRVRLTLYIFSSFLLWGRG